MKKIFLVILSLILLLTLLIFIFIPGRLIIAESRVVITTPIGFDTCLHKLEKWRQWWPGVSRPVGNDSLFTHDGYTYKLSAIYSDGATLRIESNNISAEARIQFIAYDRDSISAGWKIVFKSGNNPINRISQYKASRKLKKSMHVIFEALCHFAGKTENIYGFPIERTTFTEVNLIAYRFKSATYPTIEVIYDAVNNLRQYIISQGTAEKYYPMINTKQEDSSQYETMIAISVDKLIPASGNYFISQMIPMKDRFLATEVTGGPATLERAHSAIEKYMHDHSLSAPARPFDILITERNKETDSVKWRTKIFYPSM